MSKEYNFFGKTCFLPLFHLLLGRFALKFPFKSSSYQSSASFLGSSSVLMSVSYFGYYSFKVLLSSSRAQSDSTGWSAREFMLSFSNFSISCGCRIKVLGIFNSLVYVYIENDLNLIPRYF